MTARSELRTGTAVRPLPGWRAMRTPVPTVGGSAAATLARSSSDGRPAPARARSWATAVARQIGHADTATTRARVAAAPMTSTHGSTVTPGWSSATRAVPMGVSGDASTAMPTAAPAATVPIAAARHHAGRPQLAPGHPQGAECGVLGGFDERLARQELTHHPDGDEPEQATEEPQRDGLEMDGALDVRRLLRPDQVELGLTAHEAMDIVDERGDVGTAPPEPHHRLLEAQHLRPDGCEGGRAHVREVGGEARRELRRELTR